MANQDSQLPVHGQSPEPARRVSSVRPVMTPEMRDRQARGKNPYTIIDGSDTDEEDEPLGRGPVAEPFAVRERKAQLITLLDYPEEIQRLAQLHDSSATAQRLRLKAELFGFPLPRDVPPRPASQQQSQQQQSQQSQQQRTTPSRRG